jgi:hypothetical protein
MGSPAKILRAVHGSGRARLPMNRLTVRAMNLPLLPAMSATCRASDRQAKRCPGAPTTWTSMPDAFPRVGGRSLRSTSPCAMPSARCAASRACPRTRRSRAGRRRQLRPSCNPQKGHVPAGAWQQSSGIFSYFMLCLAVCQLTRQDGERAWVPTDGAGSPRTRRHDASAWRVLATVALDRPADLPNEPTMSLIFLDSRILEEPGGAAPDSPGQAIASRPGAASRRWMLWRTSAAARSM